MLEGLSDFYIIVYKDSNGDYQYSMAGGRGASMNSIASFTSLESAKRSLRYKQKGTTMEYSIVKVSTDGLEMVAK